MSMSRHWNAGVHPHIATTPHNVVNHDVGREHPCRVSNHGASRLTIASQDHRPTLDRASNATGLYSILSATSIITRASLRYNSQAPISSASCSVSSDTQAKPLTRHFVHHTNIKIIKARTVISGSSDLIGCQSNS